MRLAVIYSESGMAPNGQEGPKEEKISVEMAVIAVLHPNFDLYSQQGKRIQRLEQRLL